MKGSPEQPQHPHRGRYSLIVHRLSVGAGESEVLLVRGGGGGGGAYPPPPGGGGGGHPSVLDAN